MAKKEPVIIKRGSHEDWLKSNYVPEQNVIIIQDYLDGTVSFSIGDGETKAAELRNLLEQIPAKKNSSIEGNTLIL